MIVLYSYGDKAGEMNNLFHIRFAFFFLINNKVQEY